MFKYLFVTANICYGLHGEHSSHQNHGLLGVSKYVEVTLKDIATDPDLQPLTRFTQATGGKMWSYDNFTEAESVQFMRGYLHEFRRLAGDPGYAEFKTMPEDYKFTIYSVSGNLPKHIVEKYHPN